MHYERGEDLIVYINKLNGENNNAFETLKAYQTKNTMIEYINALAEKI